VAIYRKKCLVVDIDGTICPLKKPDENYTSLPAHRTLINKLKHLKEDGFRIILMSSRNMNSYDGNIGEINAHTLRPLLDWLDVNEIPYDEIHMGKPWAGQIGFYIDDRAVRPDEFLTHDIEGLVALLEAANKRLAEIERPELEGGIE
jgi:capsule biosynthesis phosphatase